MSHEPSHISDRDELHDRLIDRGLDELLRGETPPDLSQRILSAAGASAPAALILAGTHAMDAHPASRRTSGFSWMAIAVAACLLVGAAVLLVPGVGTNRERASSGSDQLAVRENRASTAAVNTTEELAEIDGEGMRYAIDELAQLGKRSQAISDDMLLEAPSHVAGPTPLPTTPPTPLAAAEPAHLSDDAQYFVPTTGAPRASASLGIQAPTGDSAGAQVSEELYWESRSGSSVAGVEGSEPFGFGVPVQDAEGVQPATRPASGGAAPVESYSRGYRFGRGVSGPANGQGGQAPAQQDGTAEHLMLGVAVNSAAGPVATSAPAATDYYAESETRLLRENLDLKSNLAASADFDDLTALAMEAKSKQYGIGPGAGGDQYGPIIEIPFQAISTANTDHRLSTFSIDVDTAAYANVRQFLMQSGMLPPPDAVRIEELVNYFDYDYSAPTGDVPFASNVEVAACPWAPEHRLVRVGIKGREMERTRRPKSNLVFLVDVSGSMDEPAKLPLLVEGMRMLTRELGENDRVAIVVYASTEGLALESTRGDQQQTILDALGRLSAGGSTAGGAGIQLAYKVAEENFIKEGVNRIILCTDGDFNVGVTSPAELQRLAEEKAKATGVFLTVIGFGRGNLNDAMMEQVADHGNGNYHYVDNRAEARKVLVEEMTGTLVTIAKDVKIQIEFNPAEVAGYRLIGYENRVLAAEDFNDDKKDAGEIGAGHTVTALYEIVPAGQKVDATKVDELKYAPPIPPSRETATAGRSGGEPGVQDQLTAMSDELLTLKIRYKTPDGDTSTKLEFPITDNDQNFSAASADFQFASAVAGFGMLLRNSQFKGNATLAGMQEIAESASRDRDPHGYRKEFVEMVTRARELSGQ